MDIDRVKQALSQAIQKLEVLKTNFDQNKFQIYKEQLWMYIKRLVNEKTISNAVRKQINKQKLSSTGVLQASPQEEVQNMINIINIILSHINNNATQRTESLRKLTEKYEEQLRRGIEVEAEHKNTYTFIKSYLRKHGDLPPAREVYLHIAKDHLEEHKDYYTRLLEAEL